MKGLLKKDLLLLKSQIKYIVMIVVICLIMAYANSGFAYISSYLTFMGTGLVFNSFSYDMYHKEMTYLFALPFSKKEYCLEKYIYALTVTFISWLIAFLISSATHINLETIIVQLAMLFSAFIYISITIPVMMKYGREKANKRIYATTDKEKGAVKVNADANNWETFVVPDSVGGRFSVLTAVGLLPIAASGADITALMEGANAARKEYTSTNVHENDAYAYAALRNILYRKGKFSEILINYEPSLQYFSEWWKQLAGESEGKDQKGIYPTSANFSTDLHSLGQWIQEGTRTVFETAIRIEKPRKNINIPELDADLDGLGYLQGKDVDFVNKKAADGVLLAHTDGNVPNMIVTLPEQDEFTLGYAIYFFELAIGVSGYLNGINPFNQPGVEAYKKNMFALLGKPGFEELSKELNDRL